MIMLDSLNDEDFQFIHQLAQNNTLCCDLCKSDQHLLLQCPELESVKSDPRRLQRLVTTLRSADEVRDPALFFGEISNGRLEKDMLDLAAQLIEQKSGPFEPSEFKDQYQETLITMVKRKLKGQKPILAKAPERGKVINLMDALRQSLEEVKKPPARSRPRKPTTAAAKSAGRAGAGGSKKKRQATGN